MKVINPATITAAMLTSSTAAEPSGTDPAAWSSATSYAVGDKSFLASTHRIYQCLIGHLGNAAASATVTMTIAAPCVVTWTGHTLPLNATVKFTTTGALPGGLLPGTTYYVTAPATNTFSLAATPNGAAITTTGTQSGTHTATAATSSPDVNTSGSTPKWLDWSATNRWKMFDAEVNTQTIVTTPLTVVFTPGAINALALLELSGTSATVTVKSAPGGSVVYSATKSLDGSVITDWYSYFTDPFTLIDSWVMTDIPAYASCEVTVSITAGSGNVYCGVMQAGLWYDIGNAQYGANVGIVDYSTKKIDSYGRTVLSVGNYSRRLNATLMMDTASFYKTHKLLVSLRAKPCIWIGSEDSLYTPTVVFGYFKDFSIDVRYPTSVYCSLQVEGLT